MKALFSIAILIFSLHSSAQYFYKDIIGTTESAELIAAYRNNKVSYVVLNSFTINNTPISNFSIRQEYFPSRQALLTVTKTEYTDPSYLTTYIDASGRVAKTTDSTGGIVNTSLYNYTPAGKLGSILITAGDSLAATRIDEHIWYYDAQNRLTKMLRIKNRKDTAVITFKLDEKGNVIEEQERRRAIAEEPYYYYYDESNRLTDIVRYNKKAGRLLPEYMFEYSSSNQLIQRITIPHNSDDYLIWRFAYNDKGLKTKEVIFNKEKVQTGKVEYQYSYGN